MLDKVLAKWFLSRVQPFREVQPEKLAADRETVRRLEEYNRNYAQFLNKAVFPAVDELVKFLSEGQIIHRVAAWGNQLCIVIHLAWRWGRLIISQIDEDAVTFEHSITTEGERRGEDSSEEHTHHYDLRDPLPPTVIQIELQFFLSRVAQDLVEPEPEAELPPGAGPPAQE